MSEDRDRPTEAEEEQEEEKVVVRDRRRVTEEGTVRESEAGPQEAPQAGPMPVTPPPPPPPADEVRERPRLQEAPPPRREPRGRSRREPAPGVEEGEEAPQGLDVYDLVRVIIMELQARAAIHMGLMPDPATNLLSPDLRRARFAIDVLVGLVDRLSETGELSPDETAELRELKRALQNAYVERAMGGRSTQQNPPQ